MRRPSRDTWFASSPDRSQLPGIEALIYVGRLDSAHKIGLALRAVNKATRLGQDALELILVAHASSDTPPAGGVQPRLLPETGRDSILDDFHAGGRLLVACRNECFGEVVLHALASGVPLSALNFRTADSSELDLLTGRGAAFLGIDHVLPAPLYTEGSTPRPRIAGPGA